MTTHEQRKQKIMAGLDSPIGHCGAQSRAFIRDTEGNPVSACPWPGVVDKLLDRIIKLEDTIKDLR